MFIPGQNQLAKPEVVTVPPFESQLKQFKQIVIAEVVKSDPEMAEKVTATLNNEAELCSKIIEACTVILQTRRREINEDALQMFAYWSEGSNLDAKVADLGIKRQRLSKGDPNAFPVVPPVDESDEALRLRYFLSPYSFSNAGSGLGYKYHAMTLGEKPIIAVDSFEPNQVSVNYQFASDSMAGKVKDASAMRTAAGEVTVTLLSREGNGAVNPALQAAVETYFKRDDVAPLTDKITISAAKVMRYKIRAQAAIDSGPDTSVIQQEAERLLKSYVNQQHRLGGTIEPSMIHHLLHQAGIKKIELLEPLQAIDTSPQQAPWCEQISIAVQTL